MCELTVYILKDNAREKAMESIFGDSMEVEGRIADVDIMAQSANIIAN
jgi:predicted RNA-binding protein